ncbi:uncharacterized protein LOC110448517 [Mizuhopecten yessoensis]|uniref:uncharacterized protein LOC110448517 n=1 Tax=Mizuhopecten yessoensis TaxID=6573 RepID=UPI000B45D9D3|nr:uncharacterized protein LOC110448517 [Mizuhopecten yessoensis]
MDLRWTFSVLLLLAVGRGSLSNVMKNERSALIRPPGPSLSPPIGTCHQNSDCGYGSCCVTDRGDTLAEGSSYMFGPGATGTCRPHVIQEHGACDYHSGCSCGPGLECYREVQGICCPPMRCLNATYVQHEKEYWHTCLSSGSCGLPP